MASANPNQQIADDINTLQSKIGDLQEGVRLTRAREAVGDLQATVNGLAARLTALRERGYVFEKDLESQTKAMAESWALLAPTIQAQLDAQSSTLINSLRPVELQMPQLEALAANPITASGLLHTLQSSVDQVEKMVSAAENAIEGMYSQFGSQVYDVTKHLDEIDYTLSQLAEATFQLLPTEAGIAAVKAVWCKTGKQQKGDPEGVLFITDQRLVFEQKEQVATKKVLFIATEKQKLQQLMLEAPVALVDTVMTSKQGLLNNEDHIEIRFKSGAPVESAAFHIWQENTACQAMINRAKTKDFDAGRAVAVDQAAVDKVRMAPSQCPNCGGNITQVILRGQDSLKCEYCGFVIRF
jgi:hypothetical protein